MYRNQMRMQEPYRDERKSNRSATADVFGAPPSPESTSRTVTKFFRDFDILQPSMPRCPVCRNTSHHSCREWYATLWAISLSWWGNFRSSPPQWIEMRPSC